jgi:predicted aspartyl protease
VSAIGSAGADDVVPDVATLQARMAAAVGPDNDNYRETVVETRTDGDMVFAVAHRGGNALTIQTHGKSRIIYGTFNGQDWKQDENGVTVADIPDPGAAGANPRTKVQRVSSPSDAYVLSVIDENGFGHRDYVDPVTYLIKRHDTIDVDGTATTTYGAYQRYGTQLLPVSYRISYDNGKTSDLYTRASVSIGVANDDDVAVPPVRQIVSVPRNLLSVDLHATFGDAGLITVPVTIGNQRLYFMLDTGSSVIAIDAHVADALGLEKVGTSKVSGAGTVSGGEVLIPSLDIGGAQMHDIFATTLPIGSGQSPSDPAGVLGFDFLAELIVNVDNAQKRVLVSDPRTFVPPAGRNVDALPVRLGSRIPLITMNVGGATAQRVVVDTGSDDGLLMFGYFARRHSNVFRDLPTEDVLKSIDPPPDYGVTIGVGGESGVRRTSVLFAHLGHYNIRALNVDVVTGRHAFTWDTDGLLGRQILNMFNLEFDFADGLIYLWPASGGP